MVHPNPSVRSRPKKKSSCGRTHNHRRIITAASCVLSTRLTIVNRGAANRVNRLKLIKQQMFGRAKFDLLRQRVLLAR